MKKSTNPTLPAISGAELLRYARDGVIAEAEAIRREVLKAVPVINAAAVVALAMAGAPGESAAVAVQTLKHRVSAMLSALSASSVELEAAQRAERDRLAGVVAAATHRGFEIQSAVERIGAIIRSGHSRNVVAREELRRAGLTGDKLDAAAAPCDFAELEAERAALVAEGEALQEFLRTRDPRHIPAGLADEIREPA